ncbi:sensor histidine kinase [Agromyces sp. NPDC058484]|uniref:sensor histidine kinase n=1 Tax=Agromyces sp. NPDC058484 TaxID=3346524 RepID=UPI00365FD859
MTRPATLRTRITLVVAAVAAVAALITGAVTIPLARGAAVAEARDRVGAQVDLLAAIDAPAASVGMVAADGTTFALVRGDAVQGPAASYATGAVRSALAGAGTFSGTVRGGNGVALVEARAAGAGAGVLGALPLREVERTQGRATGRVLLALALGVAVAVLAGWLLARWLARPLRITADSARRMAAGERAVPVPPDGPAEVREVAGALAALDAALAASEGRQREFLLSVSHELRTPLTAIRGYGEALADGLVTPGDTADVGRTLVAETERLDLFVADLLALARLEADDFVLHLSAVDVGAVVRETSSAWEGRAATLGVRLEASGTESPVVVRTDAHRVRQVLDGLVENALRATPEGGSVSILVTTDASGAALIEVADTGPGLAAADLGVAFDRGALHARYRDSRPVGTGLGLSIAARLVARLGGTIEARAGALGRGGALGRAGALGRGGAVFAVRLPMSVE